VQGEEPFMCDVCGKSFTRKKSLREHQTVHTGARPYSCQTCAKSFSTCDECDKAFKCRMGLLQHRVVHSGEKPFTCPTCGLSFGLKYNFQRHLRLHSGEKPFRYEAPNYNEYFPGLSSTAATGRTSALSVTKASC
uniref:C2H2-type domain-containing protein n=1 Tax=Oreochromis niloticus TaxID=8128 RepID=A0A669E8L8_ORENI